jgi:hypothetical protein
VGVRKETSDVYSNVRDVLSCKYDPSFTAFFELRLFEESSSSSCRFYVRAVLNLERTADRAATSFDSQRVKPVSTDHY